MTMALIETNFKRIPEQVQEDTRDMRIATQPERNDVEDD
jgi:hypothetical protein